MTNTQLRCRMCNQLVEMDREKQGLHGIVTGPRGQYPGKNGGYEATCYCDNHSQAADAAVVEAMKRELAAGVTDEGEYITANGNIRRVYTAFIERHDVSKQV